MTQKVSDYNYETFDRSQSGGRATDFTSHLRAGGEAPDFELATPTGESIKLSQYRDKKHVLLEFGSITWPPFVGEVSPLNALYEAYRSKDFEFLTIYVREPHPGEHFGPHKSFEQKLAYASQCRDEDGIRNPLLVDDLDGTVHRLYGVLPNMIYIVAKDGRIVYKAMWTDHVEIKAVLENIAMADKMREQGMRLKPSFTEKINFIPAQYAGGLREKVFDRAGPKAWEDYKATFSG